MRQKSSIKIGMQRKSYYLQKKNQGRKENFYGLNAWVQTTKLFKNLARYHSDQVSLDKLLESPAQSVSDCRGLFGFCNLELTSSTYSFLNKSLEKSIRYLFCFPKIETDSSNARQ